MKPQVNMTIKVGVRDIELTLEEARELYNTLGDLLGKPTQFPWTWNVPGDRWGWTSKK